MKKYKFDVSNVEEFAQNNKRMDFTSDSLEEMKTVEKELNSDLDFEGQVGNVKIIEVEVKEELQWKTFI